MLSTDANGSAQLIGNIVNKEDLGKGFELDINFTGFTDTIPPDPPPNDSPKLECNPSQNFDDWVYYTGYTGTLTGTGAYAGYVISVERLGPSFQQGDGASNKNLDLGASGWFSWTIEQSPQNPTIVLRSSADIPQTVWNTLRIDSLIRGDININLVPKGSLGDTVFCDLDNDGVQDDDELGIPDVTITLICDGEEEQTVETDGDGKYLFTKVPLNVDCTVIVDQNTAPALDNKVIGECPPDFDVTLDSDNPSFLDADFCFIFPGEIGNTVFCDLDNDGVQDDDEPGIPDVTITLICDGEEERTVETDADGNYLFTRVPLNADCTVIVDQNSAPSLDDKAIGECPPDFNRTLDSDNPSFPDADFCFIFPGEIGGTVFSDLDNNGVQDTKDPGIEGVLVNLRCAGPDRTFDTGDDLTTSEITNNEGEYLFEDIPAAMCVVDVDITSAPNDKKAGRNCPNRETVDLTPGEVFLDADFCFIPMCVDCEGGITKLTLEFLNLTDDDDVNEISEANIRIIEQDTKAIVFEQVVIEGKPFMFEGTGTEKTFGDELCIVVTKGDGINVKNRRDNSVDFDDDDDDDTLHLKLDTGCATKIGPDLIVIADSDVEAGKILFRVINGRSKTDDLCPVEEELVVPICPSCEEGDDDNDDDTTNNDDYNSLQAQWYGE